MAKEEMQRRGIEVSDEQIREFIPTLSPVRKAKGVEIKKTDADLHQEAKQKLTKLLAASLAPRYSLYAFRHSWATQMSRLIPHVPLSGQQHQAAQHCQQRTVWFG